MSGFLVSRSLERTSTLSSFFHKRLLRVYPALITCFIVSLAIVAIFKVLPLSTPDFWIWVLAQTTIVQFYNPSFMRDFGLGVLNGSLWTIPVEVQFYFVLPIIYFAARRGREWVFWFLAGFALVVHGVFLESVYGTNTVSAKILQVTFLPWVGFFLVGVLAQRYWSSCRAFFEGKLIFWIAAYALACWLIYNFSSGAVMGNRLPGPLALMLFGVVLSAAHTASWLSERLLAGNDISYGLYLYHGPFINAYLVANERGLIAIPAASAAFLVLLISVVFAALSWTLIERTALLRFKPHSAVVRPVA